MGLQCILYNVCTSAHTKSYTETAVSNTFNIYISINNKIRAGSGSIPIGSGIGFLYRDLLGMKAGKDKLGMALLIKACVFLCLIL